MNFSVSSRHVLLPREETRYDNDEHSSYSALTNRKLADAELHILSYIHALGQIHFLSLGMRMDPHTEPGSQMHLLMLEF